MKHVLEQTYICFPETLCLLNMVVSSCIHFSANDLTSFFLVVKNSTVYKIYFPVDSAIVGQVVYNLVVVTSTSWNIG